MIGKYINKGYFKNGGAQLCALGLRISIRLKPVADPQPVMQKINTEGI